MPIFRTLLLIYELHLNTWRLPCLCQIVIYVANCNAVQNCDRKKNQEFRSRLLFSGVGAMSSRLNYRKSPQMDYWSFNSFSLLIADLTVTAEVVLKKKTTKWLSLEILMNTFIVWQHHPIVITSLVFVKLMRITIFFGLTISWLSHLGEE